VKTLVDSARSAAQLAHQAQQKGSVVDAARLFTTSALRFLSVAVTEYPDVEAGLKFAAAENLAELLSHGAQASSELIVAVRAGRAAAKDVTGRYVFLVLSHVAVLTGARDAVGAFRDVAIAKEVGGTPFWDAYASCYANVLDETPFEAPSLSLKPAEKYWFPYIELMALLARGARGEEKQKELGALFARRNGDKRFVSADAHQIEGSPACKANWDFRLEALLRTKNN
jgi:hypothetical protein